MEKHSNQTWAITGASGYVGQALVQKLDLTGVRTRLLVRRALDRQYDHSAIIQADISNTPSLQRVLEGAQVVVHLAAHVHRPTQTASDRQECFRVNVGGTENLLLAMQDVCPTAHLVHLSSTSVYGRSDGPLTEASPCRPATAYGQAKLEAEHLIHRACGDWLSATILRPAAVFSSSSPGNLDRMIRLGRRGVLIKVGTGETQKTLLPLENLVEAIIVAGRQRASGVFNVAGGESLRMKEILSAIGRQLPRRPIVLPIPRPIFRAVSTILAVLTPVAPFGIGRLRSLMDVYDTPVIIDESKLIRLTHYEPIIAPADALAQSTLTAPAKNATRGYPGKPRLSG